MELNDIAVEIDFRDYAKLNFAVSGLGGNDFENWVVENEEKVFVRSDVVSSNKRETASVQVPSGRLIKEFYVCRDLLKH